MARAVSESAAHALAKLGPSIMRTTMDGSFQSCISPLIHLRGAMVSHGVTDATVEEHLGISLDTLRTRQCMLMGSYVHGVRRTLQRGGTPDSQEIAQFMAYAQTLGPVGDPFIKKIRTTLNAGNAATGEGGLEFVSI